VFFFFFFFQKRNIMQIHPNEGMGNRFGIEGFFDWEQMSLFKYSIVRWEMRFTS